MAPSPPPTNVKPISSSSAPSLVVSRERKRQESIISPRGFSRSGVAAHFIAQFTGGSRPQCRLVAAKLRVTFALTASALHRQYPVANRLGGKSGKSQPGRHLRCPGAGAPEPVGAAGVVKQHALGPEHPGQLVIEHL